MSVDKNLEIGEEDDGVSGFESEEMEADSELEKLEFEVNEMARKIIHYRSTLSGQLKSTFISLLESSRPVIPESSQAGTSGGADHSDEEQTESHKNATLFKGDIETAEKIKLLKNKISSNVSMIPTVLKRMKKCISTIDHLDSYNGIIHPAFKRKRTS